MGFVQVPLSHSGTLQQRESLTWVRKMNTSTCISVIMSAKDQEQSNHIIHFLSFMNIFYFPQFFQGKIIISPKARLSLNNVTHWAGGKESGEGESFRIMSRCQLLTVSPTLTHWQFRGWSGTEIGAVLRVLWWTSSSRKVRGDPGCALPEGISWHIPPPPPPTHTCPERCDVICLKWHDFKQNTETKHFVCVSSVKGSFRQRSSHRWLQRVEGLIQEPNPWMFDVGPKHTCLPQSDRYHQRRRGDGDHTQLRCTMV